MQSCANRHDRLAAIGAGALDVAAVARLGGLFYRRGG
jgi:hypothetical protein